MDQSYFSYQLKHQEKPIVNFFSTETRQHGLRIANITIWGSIDQLHEIVSKAEAMIEIEKNIISNKEDYELEKRKAEEK